MYYFLYFLGPRLCKDPIEPWKLISVQECKLLCQKRENSWFGRCKGDECTCDIV